MPRPLFKLGDVRRQTSKAFKSIVSLSQIQKKDPLHELSRMIVWQKAMELIDMTYDVVWRLPQEELYALSSQMRRAVVSIAQTLQKEPDEGLTRI